MTAVRTQLLRAVLFAVLLVAATCKADEVSADFSAAVADTTERSTESAEEEVREETSCIKFFFFLSKDSAYLYTDSYEYRDSEKVEKVKYSLFNVPRYSRRPLLFNRSSTLFIISNF